MDDSQSKINIDKNELRSIGIDRYESRSLLIYCIAAFIAFLAIMIMRETVDRHYHIFILLPIVAVCFGALKANKRKYMDCPYCGHSVLVVVDWQCDWCKNFQGKAKRINERCNHCNKYLRTAFCEHCHEEFRI